MKKTYLYFGLSSGICLIAALIFYNKVMDIQMHDTYVALGLGHLLGGIALLLGLLGLVYWLFREQKLTHWVTKIHAGFSLLYLLGMAFTAIIHASDYVNISSGIGGIFLLGFLLFSIVQSIFCIDILLSFFRNRQKG